MACRTASAVPWYQCGLSGVCSAARISTKPWLKRSIRYDWPMCRLSEAELNCVSTKIRRISACRQLLMGMSMRRYLPPIGTAGFERCSVSGNSRVPWPPPRMRASTSRMRSVYGDFACRRTCIRLWADLPTAALKADTIVGPESEPLADAVHCEDALLSVQARAHGQEFCHGCVTSRDTRCPAARRTTPTAMLRGRLHFRRNASPPRRCSGARAASAARCPGRPSG